MCFRKQFLDYIKESIYASGLWSDSSVWAMQKTHFCTLPTAIIQGFIHYSAITQDAGSTTQFDPSYSCKY